MYGRGELCGARSLETESNLLEPDVGIRRWLSKFLLLISVQVRNYEVLHTPKPYDTAPTTDTPLDPEGRTLKGQHADVLRLETLAVRISRSNP